MTTPWDVVADEQIIQKTIQALENNEIHAVVVNTGKEAKEKALELIPNGSEVMTMTSVTLDSIGVSEELNKKDGKYTSVRDKLYAMDRKTQHQEMNRLGTAPEYAIGSVHAVTEDGQVLIASNTGSQLPAYVYGASHVIWVVGAQKIVKNMNEGMKRIYEYTLPLESERAKKAYGVPGSAVNKILIINKEVQKGRISLIFVREKLGF
ncbi:MAG: LUD domain-containing protein [Candidatus Pacebacteria bacterium]|nr:LUD domain-containing protein [Candidatus Paceibacterota bacterium]